MLLTQPFVWNDPTASPPPSHPPPPLPEHNIVDPSVLKVDTKNNEKLFTIRNTTFLTITIISLALVATYSVIMLKEDESKMGDNVYQYVTSNKVSSVDASTARSIYKEQSPEAKLLSNVIRFFALAMYAANILFLYLDKAKMTRLRGDYHRHFFIKRGDKETIEGEFDTNGEDVVYTEEKYYASRTRKLKSYLWESVVVRISWAMIVLAILISDRVTDYYFDTMADNQANCALAIITFVFIGLFCISIFVFKPQICPELKDIRKKNKLNWICLC